MVGEKKYEQKTERQKKLYFFLVGLIVVAVMAWRSGRVYCNTICPVGTILGFFAKYSIFFDSLSDLCMICEYYSHIRYHFPLTLPASRLTPPGLCGIMMVDKFEAKKYVAERIGEEYNIPVIGAWDRFEDIDFASLPNQFVLKCTHDSGGLVIVRDKSKLDKEKARKKIEKSLARNYYIQGREWPYKNVKPRILAEQYMEDDSGNGLRDYKFYCFNGIVDCVLTCFDRASGDTKFYFFENQTFLTALSSGETDAKESAIKFLEFDPYYYRSGYIKSKLLVRLKNIKLSASEVKRLQKVI